MEKRIELLPNGFIQFRDIIAGVYHRSVIAPDGDTSRLPNKCDIVFMSDRSYKKDQDVKKVIKDWKNSKEIKAAIKEHKDKRRA